MAALQAMLLAIMKSNCDLAGLWMRKRDTLMRFPLALGEAMGKVSDEKLFEQLVSGDHECLRPLMERYGDALVLYANGYIHDVDAAEDLMIEAFSRMLIKRPRLRAGGFKPYLYKTVRNLALRHVRDRSRFLSLDDIAYDPIGAHDAEGDLLADERSRELYRCLAQVPAHYREALYLVYLEGMSYDEAGVIMRKTRKQMDNLVTRGKIAMRDLLGEGGLFREVD